MASQQRASGNVVTSSQLQMATNSSASRTQTTTEQSPRTLRLRGRHNANGRSVQWADDVVDNEGLGRKSSKGTFLFLLHILCTVLKYCCALVCCIYHKPKAVGESSDESSSSSSDSDSDSDANDLDRRRRAPPRRRSNNGDEKDGGHDHDDCDHDHDHDDHRPSRRRQQGDEGKKQKRKPSPNAYEKIPKVQTKEGQTKSQQ